VNCALVIFALSLFVTLASLGCEYWRSMSCLKQLNSSGVSEKLLDSYGSHRFNQMFREMIDKKVWWLSATILINIAYLLFILGFVVSLCSVLNSG